MKSRELSTIHYSLSVTKVPETGLEPAHLAIRDPKSRASANFATPACFIPTDAPKQHENKVRCNSVAIWNFADNGQLDLNDKSVCHSRERA